MSAAHIQPCNIPFAPPADQQPDADIDSSLNARQLRRRLRQLRKHLRNCQCAQGKPPLELAHEQSDLFWGGGFIPTPR